MHAQQTFVNVRRREYGTRETVSRTDQLTHTLLFDDRNTIIGVQLAGVGGGGSDNSDAGLGSERVVTGRRPHGHDSHLAVDVLGSQGARRSDTYRVYGRGARARRIVRKANYNYLLLFIIADGQRYENCGDTARATGDDDRRMQDTRCDDSPRGGADNATGSRPVDRHVRSRGGQPATASSADRSNGFARFLLIKHRRTIDEGW